MIVIFSAEGRELSEATDKVQRQYNAWYVERANKNIPGEFKVYEKVPTIHAAVAPSTPHQFGAYVLVVFYSLVVTFYADDLAQESEKLFAGAAGQGAVA